MPHALDSLIPVFLLILGGALLRRFRAIELSDWRGVEHLVYYVFMPAMLSLTLYRADLASVPVTAFAGALLAALGVITVGSLLARRWLEQYFGLEPASFTSFFQGVTRWNTYVALSVAAALGPRGLTLVGISIAAFVPLLNVLAVSVLARFAHGQPLRGRAFAMALIRNPFISSCLIGLLLNLARVPLPGFVTRTADLLGQAGLAVGLLVVGAGLDTTRLMRPKMVTLLSAAVKLMLFPLMAYGFARSFGLGSGPDLAVVVISTAVPTASNAYVLAKQAGGDATLMAEIITVQTLLAMLTMPLVMMMLA